MRRMIVLVVGLVALIAVAVSSQSPADTPPSQLQTSALAEPKIERPAPEPRFTRTTYAATDLKGSTSLLDACKGPIAVFLGVDRPTLIAEHDYCGGSSWMSKVKVGDAVRIDGEGVDDGIFVVTSLTYETRHEVKVGDLPDADAVLQTCVTKTRLVLAGLERYEA